jgi:UDPglucose 6-dehydrogenase
MHEAAALLPGVHWCTDAYDAAQGADVLVIITEWNEFRALDLDRVGAAMRTRILVDLRNVYRAEDARAQGFHYASIGRP